MTKNQILLTILGTVWKLQSKDCNQPGARANITPKQCEKLVGTGLKLLLQKQMVLPSIIWRGWMNEWMQVAFINLIFFFFFKIDFCASVICKWDESYYF